MVISSECRQQTSLAAEEEADEEGTTWRKWRVKWRSRPASSRPPFSQHAPPRARSTQTSRHLIRCNPTTNIVRTMATLSYSEGASLPPNAPQWAVAASERLKQRREHGYKSNLQIPDGVKKVLLHSCCAPCSGAMVRAFILVGDNSLLEHGWICRYKCTTWYCSFISI